MFESLDESERQRVRRWQAPRIGRVAPPDAVLPAFGNAPQLVAADVAFSASAVSGAGARTDAATRTPPVEKGDVKSGSVPASDGGSDERPGAATAEGSSASPPVERVDVGTSADDVALQRRFEEGRRQGWAEAQAARREAVVDESAALLASLRRERDGHDALLEDELIGLVRAMTRLILRRELAHDADALRGVVSEALSRLPRLSDAPLVRLHPVDAQAVGEAVAAADGEEGPGVEPGGMTIVADETLARGDCRIESGATVIDAGIDAWVASIGARHGWEESPGHLSSARGEDDDLDDTAVGGRENARSARTEAVDE